MIIFQDINKAGERISKVEKEQIVGKSVLEVFPGITKIGLFEVFKQVWKTGQPRYNPVSLYQDDRITVCDNGRGIDNFAKLLDMGNSG